MIDLHTHTTASDGRYAPGALVARAAQAGVTVLAVTDHDTVDGCAEAGDACRTAGIDYVTGIEITAAVEGADVHVLGYFIDIHASPLLAFLAEQRRARLERIHRIIERLAAHGMTLDVNVVLGPGTIDTGKSAGRPWVARAMVAAGHVPDVARAFDRWLSQGRPAFVPRSAPAPAEVFTRIHEAGGLASLAHPGLLTRDDWIPGFATDGLDAIEVHHSAHDAAATAWYIAMAARLGLATSGGSDFHGDSSHGPLEPGAVSLPADAFDALKRRR